MEVLIISKRFIIKEILGMFFSEEFKEYKFNGVRQIEDVKNIDLSKVEFMIIDADSDIIEEIVTIKKMFGNIKILVFDRNKDNNMFINSVKNNIEGYLVDITEKEDLIYIIKRVLSGRKYYDPEILQSTIVNQFDNQRKYDDFNTLTNRENEVLEMVGCGFSNKEIANKLYVTEHTVKKHITKVLSKLDMRNRKDLILYTKGKTEFGSMLA